MNVSNPVFYRNICAFRLLGSNFCGPQDSPTNLPVETCGSFSHNFRYNLLSRELLMLLCD